MSKNLIHVSGAIFTDPESGATVDANRLYADYRRLQIEAQQLRAAQPDKLRKTLEVIGVGDAADPKQAATEVLVETGFWDAAAVAALKANPLFSEDNKPQRGASVGMGM